MKEKVFKYLDALQEQVPKLGMITALVGIQDRFNVTEHEAVRLFTDWINTNNK